MGWSANRRMVVGLGLAVVAVVCAGCASAVVRDVQGDRSLILARPARVVVFDFTTGPADVQLLSSPRQEGEQALGESRHRHEQAGGRFGEQVEVHAVSYTHLTLPTN